MKKILLLLLLCLLTLPASAADVSAEQALALDTDGLVSSLPQAAADILGDSSVTDALEPEGILKRIWTSARESAENALQNELKGAAAMLSIALLCAAAEIFAPEKSMAYVELGGALGVAAVAVNDLRGFIGLGTETLHSLSDFSKALLPTMAAAAAAGGAVTSGAAKYAATALFFDVLLTLADKLVMPLIYGFLALVIARAALGNGMLSGGASLLKWGAGSLITLLMLAFTLYLSITGVISGTADAAAAKLTKTAISTALPVVGSILSDAAGTLLAGAGILRNAVGIFGMLAVLCVCLTPFLRLGVQYLAYKAAAALSGLVAGKRLQELISGIGSAFAMIMGLVGAGGMMLFFSLIASVKAVTGT